MYTHHLPVKILLFVLVLTPMATAGQAPIQNRQDTAQYRSHSLDFCPISPLIGIYALHYGYRFTPRDEVIVSPSYMRIAHQGIGHTNAPGFIVGYRRYLWKNLHVDYQLMPMWDRYYDENEQKEYPVGFDLWNEFRLGYAFDFQVGQVPLFLNVQWPLGFILYSDSSAKPESFRQYARENPLFYFPPLFFLGIRF